MSEVTAENVSTVVEYVSVRSRNDTRAVLSLVSEDVVLESTFASAKGKEAYGRYLDKNRAKGEWGEPYRKDGADHVGMDGAVKIAFMTVRLASRFYFDADGKICRISVGRAGAAGG